MFQTVQGHWTFSTALKASDPVDPDVYFVEIWSTLADVMNTT